MTLALVAAACGSQSDTAIAESDDVDQAAETEAVDGATSEASDAGDDAGDTADTTSGEPQGETTVDVVAGSTEDINGGKPASVTPGGSAPLSLEITDLIEGDGDAAAPGDLLVMHYVGVLHADGSEFDSSWDRGQTFSFPLGQGRVIQGWDEGIVGMQEGGRRILSIPAEQAYGEASPSAAIPSNSPLVFVVDLIDTISPPDVENAPAPVTELEVTVFEEGDGAVLANGDVVQLHFVAILQTTGEVIASTFASGQPTVFTLGVDTVLPAWDEALPGLRQGDWVRMVVPPELGLDDPSGAIPEDATIITEVFIAAVN